ncbi:MAG: beta-phosphoglucomutase family hydrolase [Anaerolineaceae bacterium]|nr:beta-phosphoglucomutase family hydrolase [Anaerolineaceae bacterium]
MSLEIHALIFDLDGVIADTNALHYQSWAQLAQEEQIPFGPSQHDRMLGLPRHKCLEIFLDGRSLSEAGQMDWMARKNRYFLEQLAAFTAQDRAPGVAELIREARAAGLKVALGSSSQNARLVLTQLALIDEFDVIGDGLTVKNTKPAPDIFLWAAGQLGASPAHTVVFEDSEAGVAAGRSGGFWVVGIGDALVQAAHLVVPTLAEVTLPVLAAGLGG